MHFAERAPAAPFWLPATRRQEKLSCALKRSTKQGASSLLIETAADMITTGFSQNRIFFEIIIFIQQDVVSSLSYYNTQMIHNNKFLLAVKA